MRNFCRLYMCDSRKILKEYENQVNLIMTSPPYADARKEQYGGVSPEEFPEWFATFHESFWNALTDDGSLVINIKDKVVDGVRNRYVWKTIEKLSDLGWKCIDDFIWNKTNPVPGYWPSRLRDGWEYCFHLSKTTRPFFNAQNVAVPIGEWAKTYDFSKADGKSYSSNNSGYTQNRKSYENKETILPSNVITLGVSGSKIHPAVFPLGLPTFFIKLLCPENGLVVDPFGGSGTTAVAALNENRNVVAIDCKKEYHVLMVENVRNRAENGGNIDLEFFPPIEKSFDFMESV